MQENNQDGNQNRDQSLSLNLCSQKKHSIRKFKDEHPVLYTLAITSSEVLLIAGASLILSSLVKETSASPTLGIKRMPLPNMPVTASAISSSCASTKSVNSQPVFTAFEWPGNGCLVKLHDNQQVSPRKIQEMTTMGLSGCEGYTYRNGGQCHRHS